MSDLPPIGARVKVKAMPAAAPVDLHHRNQTGTVKRYMHGNQQLVLVLLDDVQFGQPRKAEEIFFYPESLEVIS